MAEATRYAVSFKENLCPYLIVCGGRGFKFRFNRKSPLMPIYSQKGSFDCNKSELNVKNWFLTADVAKMHLFKYWNRKCWTARCLIKSVDVPLTPELYVQITGIASTRPTATDLEWNLWCHRVVLGTGRFNDRDWVIQGAQALAWQITTTYKGWKIVDLSRWSQ